MSEIIEAAVVGAGMFGSAAAKHLSRAGVDVLVIGPAEPEAGASTSQHAFGAHFDEARITRRLGWDPVWGALDARSQDRFRDIEAESGIDFFHECGSLVLMARSIDHRTTAILRQCAAESIDVDRLSEQELRIEFPEFACLPMTGGVEGLLERKQAGYLNPRRLVQAQMTIAEAAGARLLRAAVTAVEKDERSGLWHLKVQADGQTRQIRAEKVLIATGAFTNENNVLPAGHRLALHAFTEPNLLFEVADGQLDQMRHLPTVVTVDPEDTGDENMSLYLLPPIQYPDGKWYMRIGPGMQPFVEELHTVDEMVGWYARQQVTPRQTASLTAMMRLLVPSLGPVAVRGAGCIIEKTPSRYPYIGHLADDPGITVAVGGNGHGARGSDEIGRLAASVLLGLPWDCPVPVETFAPLLQSAETRAGGRPAFLKPPFGLC
ncbi:NAD(P)/FAD-dependent oxidoreductase [Micromonospora rubida]|uniref:NAD(P)/FAD-dependent oxidoreductase n=1 Tax=Micromonospora rubida TaxID=2697657 RepID=A0ABW7ST23_9ACTN